MSGDSLSPLQHRILKVLAGLAPPWTLSGGAALVGFHLGYRKTRDLDLFWRNREVLGALSSQALDRLRGDGLDVLVLRTEHAFGQFLVDDGTETCVVDLIAEPFGPIEEPMAVELEGETIAVDSRRELLANKLATLLERSEVRDLADVKVLLDAGGDLEAALLDAPKKDTGFSPLTLAWVLERYDLRPAAGALGLTNEEVQELSSFRDELVERVTRSAAPD